MTKLNQITKDNHEHQGGEEDHRAVEQIKEAPESEKREIAIPNKWVNELTVVYVLP